MSKAHPEKTSSSIIKDFIEAKQNIEYDALFELKKQAKFLDEQLKDRRINLNKEGTTLLSGKKMITESFNNALKSAEKYKSMDEHKVSLEELFKRLVLDQHRGLSSKEAQIRNKDLGDNTLHHAKKEPWFIRLIKEMIGFFSLLLWLGSILSFIAYALSPEDSSNLYLGIVLGLVVIITGFITFYQNNKSESMMDSFKNFIPPQCLTLRDEEWKIIEACKLVPGDIIDIKEGQKIPADIRIISSQEMKVDNSSLTGESELLLRTSMCTNPENPLETDNIAFSGTLCKEGRATGIVIFIGNSSIIGLIATLTSTAYTEQASPLN